MERYRFSDEQRALLEGLPTPLAVYQLLGKRVVTLILSEGLWRLFGYESKEQAYLDMAQNVFQYEHPDDAARVADEGLRFATEGGTYEVIYRARPRGGKDYRMIHAIGRHLHPLPGVQLAVIGYTDEGPCREESAEKLSIELYHSLEKALHEDRIRRISFFDHLTGLPSMTYFFEMAELGRTAIENEGGQAVMMFLDLCGMKYYNTRYGFPEGDKLLRSFAALLSETFANDNCSRIGADHFAVSTSLEGVEEILKGLFAKTRELNGGKSLPVHVGIYLAGTENISASEAYDRAKLTSDSLKNQYGSCYKFYKVELRSSAELRQYILSNLDKAIDEEWIKVYYQGIADAKSGRFCDEEALARWIDPERGFLSPADFIPFLEEASLIYKLDLFVLEQVLAKMRMLRDKGLPVLPHSINLSRSDFAGCDIVEEIRNRVDRSGIERRMISVEITESLFGSDFDYIKLQVGRFRELGFPVWMDDFGSGYSSFEVLQSIRFDLVKFDMSFMKKLDQGSNTKVILRHLMQLATELGLDTVCEGVETASQVDFLREIGCGKLQGYYFAKPMPLADAVERIDARTS